MKFCPSCGTPFVCPHCGALNQVGVFCAECGKEIEPATTKTTIATEAPPKISKDPKDDFEAAPKVPKGLESSKETAPPKEPPKASKETSSKLHPTSSKAPKDDKKEAFRGGPKSPKDLPNVPAKESVSPSVKLTTEEIGRLRVLTKRYNASPGKILRWVAVLLSQCSELPQPIIGAGGQTVTYNVTRTEHAAIRARVGAGSVSGHVRGMLMEIAEREGQ